MAKTKSKKKKKKGAGKTYDTAVLLAGLLGIMLMLGRKAEAGEQIWENMTVSLS